MKYDASNKADLEAFAQLVDLIPTEDQLVEFLARSFAAGRMKSGFIDPEAGDVTEDIKEMLAGHDEEELFLFYSLLLSVGQTLGMSAKDTDDSVPLCVSARHAMVDHILNGKDETPNSTAVGGYNQDELDSLVKLYQEVVGA